MNPEEALFIVVTSGGLRSIPDSVRRGYAVKWPKLLKMNVVQSIRRERRSLVKRIWGAFIQVLSKQELWEDMNRQETRMQRVTTWGLPRGMTPDTPRDFVGNESNPNALSHLQ
jgi:hypothetical protein